MFARIEEMEQESDYQLRCVPAKMFDWVPVTDARWSVWFQHYRKENFHDESLPPGKWTKRESKQNWVSTPCTIREVDVRSDSSSHA